MPRRFKVNKKRSARKFGKARGRTPYLNIRPAPMRGGIRL